MAKRGAAENCCLPVKSCGKIAEDYHNMAKEGDGKGDYLRTRDYLWLIKLANRIPEAGKTLRLPC
jgi:hypothetical protein